MVLQKKHLENSGCDVNFHQLETPKTSQPSCLTKMVRIPRFSRQVSFRCCPLQHETFRAMAMMDRSCHQSGRSDPRELCSVVVKGGYVEPVIKTHKRDTSIEILVG